MAWITMVLIPKGFEWNNVRIDFLLIWVLKLQLSLYWVFILVFMLQPLLFRLSTGFLIRDYMQSKQSFSLIFF